jgi:hypothetical protein
VADGVLCSIQFRFAKTNNVCLQMTNRRANCGELASILIQFTAIDILASKERKELLQQRILEAQMQNDKKVARSSKKISQAEDMKALHSKLRLISQDGNQKSSLNRLEVPLDPQEDPKTFHEWVTVDAPEEITAYLLERNRKHFSQALGTPFTVPPLNVQVDYGASTTSCKLMLKGAYDSELLDDLTLY